MERIRRDIWRSCNLSLALIALTSCVVLGHHLWSFTTKSAHSYAAKQPDVIASKTIDTDQITLHAARRGNPWINLSDGKDLLTTYSGPSELQQVLLQNQARPLALASADFDEDGVPDLVCGYAHSSGGIITLHRGNVDSIFPNSPEAKQRKANGEFTDAPFLPSASVFAVPGDPEFLGAGDFDADGHWDVVAAAKGGTVLNLLPGNGRGEFSESKHIQLPGGVTALVTGEINRADGLVDLVVGISGAGSPKVLVFEGPEGALRSVPEAFALPAEATGLALGQLDDEYTMDLAVAAGRDLMVIHGRDRKLSLDEAMQAEVQTAELSRRSFPFAVTRVMLGDFAGNRRTDLALLSEDGKVHLLRNEKARVKNRSVTKRIDNWKSRVIASGSWPAAAQLVCARVSAQAGGDLLVLDSANYRVNIIAALKEGKDVQFTEGSEKPYEQIALDVKGGPVAVLPMRLNGDALSDLVVLKDGPSAITVAMTQPMAIFTVNDARDLGDCNLMDGVCNSGTINPDTGECIITGGCTLRAAIQNANASPGADAIVFGVPSVTASSSLPAITGVVTIDGTTKAGGRTHLIGGGLSISAGSSTVRGMVIIQASFGIDLAKNGGNVIEGNFVGTDGTLALGNASVGVFIGDSPNNTVGGTTAAARNILSSNGAEPLRLGGVVIAGAGATGNQILGNFVGTDVTGNMALGNHWQGVLLNSPNNTVGGTTPGAGNVISGNGLYGVLMFGNGTSGNLVQGNFIGTNVDGTATIGNAAGIFIFGDPPNNTIGGTTLAARNIISGNGTDSFGGPGVFILGPTASGNQVLGNYIGTDVNGTAALGNRISGVYIVDAPNNTIGGATAGARNIISGNGLTGVAIFATRSTGNQVLGNFIGTNITGMEALANADGGVFIQDASNNRIGGTGNGAGNVIAFNGGIGVGVFSGTGNAILSNSIHSNVGLGIDLGGNGVTPNDCGDTDMGANNLMNFPLITSVANSDTNTIVDGLIDTGPGQVRIEFFSNTDGDPSGFGEGQTFLGSITIMVSGVTRFTATLPAVPESQIITATATDAAGNTSEFSASRPLPDLIVDGARLVNEMDICQREFREDVPGDICAVEECVNAFGVRRLLRFTAATPNIGTGDLVLGRPAETPDRFVYHPCHMHYHFNGFTQYTLYDAGGKVVTARKQGFCIRDQEERRDCRGYPRRYAHNCEPTSIQGISVGWQDVYILGLECQWLDITGVPPGNYTLEVIVNPDRLFEESDYSNNVVRVPVTIPVTIMPCPSP